MLMGEIQKLAANSAATAENIRLLREDWNNMRPSIAKCEDVERVENDLKKHVEEHSESRRFNISTLVALVASGASLAGVFIGWANLEAFIKSLPKGKP
jgi:hypothetical protein